MYCTVVGDSQIVPLGQMKDGDLAAIVSWRSYPERTGRVVQRYGNALVMVGAHSGKSFSTIFAGGGPTDGCVVRILKAGETIQRN